MRAFISGIAGTLGSSLAELLLNKGFKVKGNDIQRLEEAWKLKDVIGRIEYLWKSSWDLDVNDLKDVDVVFDCSIAFADRPMGSSSPAHVLIGNLMPPLRLLEVVRRLERKPVVVYASSFNSLYGHPPGTVFTEKTPPLPSNLYGATKACAELIYQSYHKAYGIPIIITRVGSAFGSKGRIDELPHKLIYYCLKGRDFYLRSPQAKRLWTYSEDVLDFYSKLIERVDDFIGEVLHCAGNRGDEIVTNLELANRIKRLTGSDIRIIEGEYEPGELVNGKPIDFGIDSTYTRKRLGWNPKHSLNEGLRKTINWFRGWLGRA